MPLSFSLQTVPSSPFAEEFEYQLDLNVDKILRQQYFDRLFEAKTTDNNNSNVVNNNNNNNHNDECAAVVESVAAAATTPKIQFSPEQLEHINTQLEAASLQEVLRWCFVTLPGLVQVSSFGASGMVIMHELQQMGVKLPTVFVDTLHNFPETLEHIRASTAKYALDLKTAQPIGARDADEFARVYGEKLWKNDSDLYYQVAKVEPLARALNETRASAWINGRRRDQEGERSKLRIVEVDAADGRIKVNPLANWTSEQVWNYIHANGVLYNPLHDSGYKSIGDAHSTRPTLAGASERSGRSFSESASKTECGLHSNRNPERLRRLEEIRLKKLAQQANAAQQQ